MGEQRAVEGVGGDLLHCAFGILLLADAPLAYDCLCP